MIELENDSLVVTFPEVHPEAVLTIDFQRTLRIPDDGREHRLPPGLGRFPVRHTDIRWRWKLLDYNRDDCVATRVVRDWVGATEQ